VDVDQKLLAQAVAELGVTVPVMRAEASGAGLKLWLYGGDGQPVTWMPEAQAKPAQAQPKAAAKPKATSRSRARSTRKKAKET
jgi:hypothetical protein